jgi:hypothetical protein
MIYYPTTADADCDTDWSAKLMFVRDEGKTLRFIGGQRMARDGWRLNRRLGTVFPAN